MKYLHISPPWYVFQNKARQPNVPLGAAYCARAAIEIGWQATIWNGDLLPEGGENQYSAEMDGYSDYLDTAMDPKHPVWDELRLTLQEIQPDCVGITSLTPSFPSALQCAKIAKQEVPYAKVIIGGPHPSAIAEQVVAAPNIDTVVVGEGELALQYLLSLIRAGAELPKLHSEPNIKSLHNFYWPARGAILDRHGLMQRDNYGLLFWARGCPWSCEFCASYETWTRKIRWRRANDVAFEMMAIHQEYGTRYFSFEDDTFVIDRKRNIELMDEIIKTGLPEVPGFRWTCNTRPELLTEEVLVKMREAGCAAVAIGIEFGSERMLKKVKKAFTVEDVRRATRLIKSVGIEPSGQFMVGYPTETIEEMMQTVDLAEELEMTSVMLSVATPLPSTPLHREALALGLVDETIDWATVTTKNDGMLMTTPLTTKAGDTVYLPMHPEVKTEVLGNIKARFDAIQDKTLDQKNKSRMDYERHYLPDDELVPVYGIRA